MSSSDANAVIPDAAQRRSGTPRGLATVEESREVPALAALGRDDKDVIFAIWRILADVPDPEIPAVSIVDLGIVRDVAWTQGRLVVSVTPTYSGCPATAVIAFEIGEALRRNGFPDAELKTLLSPPWTTAWISAQGREKLLRYGIAPPVEAAACAGALTPPANIACPRCSSTLTERVSQFGSTPCKAHYRCTQCLEPFDYFKAF